MGENFDIEQAESVSNSEVGKGFAMRFELSDKDVVDSIYQSLLNGESGQIAGLSMKSPLQVVAVLAHSDGGESFGLSAHIVVNKTDFVDEERGVDEITRDIVLELSDGIGEKKEGEVDCYKLSTKNYGDVVISIEEEGSMLSIRMGRTDKYMDNKEENLNGLPKLTKENLKEYLSVILNITNVAVQGFYKERDVSTYSPVLKITELMSVRQYAEDSMMISNRKALLERIEVKNMPSYTLDDIGGQGKAKEILELCLLGFNSPEVYKKWGVKPPRSMLLYGPLGTGKTLMGNVLASSSNSRFLYVKPADIISGCYGTPERALKDVFDYARQGQRRTVVFFDDIDALAPSGEEAYEDVEIVVGTLLAEMDRLLDSSNVFVVGATNNLDDLDDVLQKESKFTHIVKVELPNTEEKLEIFNIHINKAEDYAKNKLFEDIDWEQVEKEIDGFSGADIVEVVRRVLEEKVKEELHGGNPSLVSTEDLLNVIQEYNSRHEKKNPLGFVAEN